MMKAAIFVALAAAVTAGAAFAQQPTAQEQAACRTDAMRHCSAHVGKPTEMNACLKANKDKLSASCKAVVEARGG
jgi:hypothetical protein